MQNQSLESFLQQALRSNPKFVREWNDTAWENWLNVVRDDRVKVWGDQPRPSFNLLRNLKLRKVPDWVVDQLLHYEAGMLLRRIMRELTEAEAFNAASAQS